METRSRTWLVRNVRHVCDGEGRRFGISRETVRSATSMPSLRSSPWILGAPHRGLAAAIWAPARGVQGRPAGGPRRSGGGGGARGGGTVAAARRRRGRGGR